MKTRAAARLARRQDFVSNLFNFYYAIKFYFIEYVIDVNSFSFIFYYSYFKKIKLAINCKVLGYCYLLSAVDRITRLKCHLQVNFISLHNDLNKCVYVRREGSGPTINHLVWLHKNLLSSPGAATKGVLVN